MHTHRLAHKHTTYTIERMGIKTEKKAVAPTPKKRCTINLPADAHMNLSRIALDITKKTGVHTHKQTVMARMISAFKKKPQLMYLLLK